MIVNENFLRGVGTVGQKHISFIANQFPDRRIWLDWRGQTIVVEVQEFGEFRITPKGIKKREMTVKISLVGLRKYGNT